MTDKQAKPGADIHLLLLVLGFLVFLWFIFPHELVASDPGAYSRLGYLVSVGDFFDSSPGNIFVHRLGVTVPTGVAYALFGVSIYTTNLWPLMVGMIMLATIWFALPSRRARVIGVALCATNQVFFLLASNLYPDLVAAAFMGLSTLLLINRERSLAPGGFYIIAISAIVSLFVAFLAKLSSYWVAPLWILLFFQDMHGRRWDLLRRFYIPALLTGIVLALIYLIYNQMAWGDALVRFRNVSEVVDAGLWAIYGPGGEGSLLHRLTVGAGELVFSTFGLMLVPACLAVFIAPKPMREWAYYSILTLLFFWFGTASMNSYQPMPLVQRNVLPSLPGLCVLAAYFIAHYNFPGQDQRRMMNLLAGVLAVSISVFYFNGFVSGWKAKFWPQRYAMQAMQEDMSSAPDAEYLLVTQDVRSPSSLEFFLLI